MSYKNVLQKTISTRGRNSNRQMAPKRDLSFTFYSIYLKKSLPFLWTTMEQRFRKLRSVLWRSVFCSFSLATTTGYTLSLGLWHVPCYEQGRCPSLHTRGASASTETRFRGIKRGEKEKLPNFHIKKNNIFIIGLNRLI